MSSLVMTAPSDHPGSWDRTPGMLLAANLEEYRVRRLMAERPGSLDLCMDSFSRIYATLWPNHRQAEVAGESGEKNVLHATRREVRL
jgi:hypothetical protein